MIDADRTTHVGEHIISLDEEDMFHMTIVGDIDEEVALNFIKSLEELEGKYGKTRRNIFIDNNKSGKISSKARKIFHELDSRETTGKVAIFGLHPVARVLASFYIGMSGNRKMQFFNSKERALNWLKD